MTIADETGYFGDYGGGADRRLSRRARTRRAAPAAGSHMTSLNSAFADLPATPRMPALFVGHGNPMNAIEDNSYSRAWRAMGVRLPTPHAILCVSAHWMTRGTTLVHIGARPK